MSYWRNRVGGLTLDDPEDLLANPHNPRRHPAIQRDALRASLDELGWIAPIVVNDVTGHVVDGHARIEEAITEGIPAIPVVHVELTPDEERLAVAIFDPITNWAVNDQERLDELIASIESDNEVINAILAALSGEDVDSAPIHAGRGDRKSLVLTYDDDEFTEVCGALSLLAGADPSDKILRLLRSTLG